MQTADKFIDFFYLCEDDEEIRKLEKYLAIQRPTMDKEFKENGDKTIISEKFKIEIFFSDISNFDKNIESNQKCQIIFSGVRLNKNSLIKLPFQLSFDNGLKQVIKKIGKEPDYSSKHFPKKIWHLKNNKEKDYLMYITFDNEYNFIYSLTLQTYDDSIKYLLK